MSITLAMPKVNTTVNKLRKAEEALIHTLSYMACNHCHGTGRVIEIRRYWDYNQALKYEVPSQCAHCSGLGFSPYVFAVEIVKCLNQEQLQQAVEMASERTIRATKNFFDTFTDAQVDKWAKGMNGL